MAARSVTKRNGVAFFQRLIVQGGPETVSISFAARESVIKEMGNLFPHEGQRARMEQRMMRHALAAPPVGQVGAQPFVHKPTVSIAAARDAFLDFSGVPAANQPTAHNTNI